MRKKWSFGAKRVCLIAAPSGVDSGPLEETLLSAGFVVETASTEAGALSAQESGRLAAVFVSQRLGPLALASVVARAAHSHPQIPVVVLGASASVQDAVDAIQHGCADYFTLPIDPEVLLLRLRRILDQPAEAPAGTGALQPGFMGLVGGSPAIRRVLESIEKISRYKTNVLVLGESGTGKELIARALHARGPRRQSLFVPLNCATLGRDILENELFGHDKGAFTGANERKQGLFELADGGTLFLDEIGEMDPGTQPKLLRVLERNEFRRVGGATKVRVDLSVIAATNIKLEESIRSGKFREDLYYRLKVVTIVIPPLRARKEDIPALIETFIADFNRRHGGKIRGIAPQALKSIMEYSWPGNVRELKNAVDSAAILANGETIGPESFAELTGTPREPRSAVTAGPSGALTFAVGVSLAHVERALIQSTMRRYKTKKEVARILGIGLRTLYTKLEEYGIAP
jgi:DNA-binding NtrC family response regulator